MNDVPIMPNAPPTPTVNVAPPAVAPPTETAPVSVAPPTVGPPIVAVASPATAAHSNAPAVTPQGSSRSAQANISANNNPPVVTLDQMVSDIQHAQDTPGVSFAKSTTNNSPGYIQQRRRIVTDFVESLWKQSPKYDTYLVRTTKDVPSFFPSQEVELLFVLLSGPAEKRKKVMILNEMLVDWVATARKKSTGRSGSIFHSPATLNYMVRSLFSSTKEYYHWLFCYGDFNFEGGFNGFFKTLCANSRKDDVSENELLKFLNENAIEN